MPEGFFGALYKRFFLRDVMGKFAPGAVVLAAIWWRVGAVPPWKDPWLPAEGLWLWSLLLLAVPVAHTVGVALQVVAERIGLHASPPRPQRILFFIKPWKHAAKDYDDRLALIRTATPAEWPEGAEEQRERFVALKEAPGNLGPAVLVASLLFAPTHQWAWYVGLGLSVALLAAHYDMTGRQASFEINALERTGRLSKEQAARMRAHL